MDHNHFRNHTRFLVLKKKEFCHEMKEKKEKLREIIFFFLF